MRTSPPARVLSRLWATDPFLKNILHELVEKNNSITKLIQYRPAIKAAYAENRKTCFEDVTVSQRVRDFAFAAHRYHTESRVLLRLVLTWDATITTAAQTILLRGHTSPEGASCLLTLTNLDSEMCLQLGMMADMAQETSKFVALCDCDDLDESELANQIEDLKAILHKRFVDGMCVQIPGLKRFMLDALRRPKTFLLNGRERRRSARWSLFLQTFSPVA